MLVRLMEVVWIHDDFIKPPGPKMVVCVEPTLGLFYRINTQDKWQIGVLLEQASNSFLDHDSYIDHLWAGGLYEIVMYPYNLHQADQHIVTAA